jgi:hypothetical protein
MCGWEASADDDLQRHGTSSQTEPASTPKIIQDQQSSGGSSSNKYQCSGIPSIPVWQSTLPYPSVSEAKSDEQDVAVRH